MSRDDERAGLDVSAVDTMTIKSTVPMPRSRSPIEKTFVNGSSRGSAKMSPRNESRSAPTSTFDAAEVSSPVAAHASGLTGIWPPFETMAIAFSAIPRKSGSRTRWRKFAKRERKEQRVGREVERLEEHLGNELAQAREENDLEAERREHGPAVAKLEAEKTGGLPAEKHGESDAERDAWEEEHLTRGRGRGGLRNGRCGRPAARAGHSVRQRASST